MDDLRAGSRLIKNAALCEFSVESIEHSDFAPEGSTEAIVQLDEDDVETGAIAFMFALLVLSFHHARPRGVSGETGGYREEDEFDIDDFIHRAEFSRRGLRAHVDYLRGRMVKTTVEIDAGGRVRVLTVNRGRSASRWFELLKGRKHLGAIEGRESPHRIDEGGVAAPRFGSLNL